MIAEEYKQMLGKKSVIRELSEYGTERAKEIGYEKVFDYSLGNPSVPVPQAFTDKLIELAASKNSAAVHGYSPSLGISSVP
jgi:Aspartate/tyrosine/aromatic aminotransferase